jgi:hypothetical protein
VRPPARALFAVVAALAGSPALAAAQDAHLNVFVPERSYAALGTPEVIGAPAYYAESAEPPLLSEAQMIAHFALRRGLVEQEISEGTSAGVSFNLFLSTQFRLRGLNVPSGPVRSPSFMPRFVGQILRSTGGDLQSPTSGPRSIWGATITLGHHSNGGDGCVFADEVSTSGVACQSSLPAGTPANQRQVRVTPGNFSTNYLELGLDKRWGAVSDEGGGVYWTRFLDAGLVYQYNHGFGFPLPGGAEGGFADLYGRSRWRLQAEGMHLVFGRSTALRGIASVELWNPELDAYPGARNNRIMAQLFVQPTGDPAAATRLARVWARLRLIGLGARYVRGQDYYNTQFVRDIEAVQFVLNVDPWSPFLAR